MPETDTHREDIFLRKLMNKANIGWWEADVKTECYKCSGFIAQLLGLDEDGIISFNDFNKRILREDQQHTTSHSFDELQQTIEEVYLLDTPKGGVWIRSKICYQETDEAGNTKIYGIAETQDGPHMASAYQALQNSERILHNIYKNIPVGIELYNKDGLLIDLNKKELEMFHIASKEDVLGVNLFENPLLPEEIKQKLRNNEDADFTFCYEFSKINGYYQSQNSGGSIDLTTKVTTLYDHNHEPINYLVINVDKTENTIAYNKIQEFYGLDPETITAKDIICIVKSWKEAVIGLDRMVYNDARKEFSMSSMTGFGADGSQDEMKLDFEQVRGDFESNPFVTAVLEHIDDKNALGDELINRIGQLG